MWKFPEALGALIPETTDLFMSGLQWLNTLAGSEKELRLEDEWKPLGEVECLSAGSCLGIFLKDLKSLGHPVLPLRLALTPDAGAEILEPLFMHPGKARRLECSDVPFRLRIPVNSPGTRDVEAAALKVDKNDVEISDNCLVVNVKILNHAYTKASLRLQPNRRSHGGRVYDHVALKQGKGFQNLWKPFGANKSKRCGRN